jgi:hypothetical protein
MKKTLLLLLSATLAFNLNAQKTYRISGHLTNQNNETITLRYFEGTQLVENSTAAVDGSFTLTGPAPTQPTVVRLSTSVDRNLYLGEQKTSMYLPAIPLELVLSQVCDVNITGDVMDLNLATLSGDSYNEGMNKLHQLEAPLTRRMAEQLNYFSQAKKMGLTDELTSIGKKMLEIRTETTALRKKFISENPSEFTSVWLLSITAKEYAPQELKAAYEGLAENLRKSSYGLVVADLIKSNAEKTTK